MGVEDTGWKDVLHSDLPKVFFAVHGSSCDAEAVARSQMVKDPHMYFP